jgi:hypothetical protein
MKSSRLFAPLVFGAALASGSPARAAVFNHDAVTPPASATEEIAATLSRPIETARGFNTGPVFLVEDLDARPDVARFVFPNLFDLQHEKQLTFTGTIRFGPGNEASFASVGMTFDWLNPDTGEFDVTGLVGFANLTADNPEAPLTGEFTIPFCPAEVSIEFFLMDALPGTVVLVTGQFTHECLVPEPGATAALAGVALAGFALWRRRRG